jgi:LmbE family N-acetylglucosaminyl deacetylase
VCIVTKPYVPYWSEEYIRKKEVAQIKVDKFLGIIKRYNLNLPTVKLNMIPTGEFNQKIANVVNDINPNIIYTHDKSDLNNDHKLVFQACLVAARPPKRISLITFETLSETEWGSETFQPTSFVNIASTIDRKIEAMSMYETELKEYPHPRSLEGIRVLAKYRGMTACLEYAEAFKLIREVIK